MISDKLQGLVGRKLWFRIDKGDVCFGICVECHEKWEFFLWEANGGWRYTFELKINESTSRHRNVPTHSRSCTQPSVLLLKSDYACGCDYPSAGADGALKGEEGSFHSHTAQTERTKGAVSGMACIYIANNCTATESTTESRARSIGRCAASAQ